MNIQIFGTSKCFDTKKAQRYFKERGIKFQMIDLKEKEMSRGEFEHVARALGGEVAYTSTSGGVREEEYPALPLDELLGWADVVSIHAPLNERTRGLIGARELARMKPSAILINVARGGIVDEAALAAALDRGELAGAGLDVFAHEPIEEGNPLLSVREPDRLLLSPHNAWSPVEAVGVLVECIARNIRGFYGIG